MSLVQLVGALASAIRVSFLGVSANARLTLPQISQLQDLSKMRTITVWVVLWFGGSALADTLIAAAMIMLVCTLSIYSV